MSFTATNIFDVLREDGPAPKKAPVKQEPAKKPAQQPQQQVVGEAAGKKQQGGPKPQSGQPRREGGDGQRGGRGGGARGGRGGENQRREPRPNNNFIAPAAVDADAWTVDAPAQASRSDRPNTFRGPRGGARGGSGGGRGRDFDRRSGQAYRDDPSGKKGGAGKGNWGKDDNAPAPAGDADDWSMPAPTPSAGGDFEAREPREARPPRERTAEEKEWDAFKAEKAAKRAAEDAEDAKKVLFSDFQKAQEERSAALAEFLKTKKTAVAPATARLPNEGVVLATDGVLIRKDDDILSSKPKEEKEKKAKEGAVSVDKIFDFKLPAIARGSEGGGRGARGGRGGRGGGGRGGDRDREPRGGEGRQNQGPRTAPRGIENSAQNFPSLPVAK